MEIFHLQKLLNVALAVPELQHTTISSFVTRVVEQDAELANLELGACHAFGIRRGQSKHPRADLGWRIGSWETGPMGRAPGNPLHALIRHLLFKSHVAWMVKMVELLLQLATHNLARRSQTSMFKASLNPHTFEITVLR